jgi:hypothetical protein
MTEETLTLLKRAQFAICTFKQDLRTLDFSSRSQCLALRDVLDDVDKVRRALYAKAIRVDCLDQIGHDNKDFENDILMAISLELDRQIVRCWRMLKDPVDAAVADLNRQDAIRIMDQ